MTTLRFKSVQQKDMELIIVRNIGFNSDFATLSLFKDCQNNRELNIASYFKIQKGSGIP